MIIGPLWLFTPLALGVWFYLVYTYVCSYREAALAGLLLGLATSGAGLISLLEMMPATTSETFLPTLLTTVLLWSIPTLALSIPTICVALGVYALKENSFLPLILPFLLLLNEEGKMWAWTLVSYGPGAILEPHLSITALAYALSENPLTLSVASLGGLPVLTLFLGCMASGIALCISLYTHAHKKKTWLVSLGVLVLTVGAMLTLTLTHATSRTGERSVSAMLLSSYYGTDSFTPLHIDTTQPPPDIFILPEGKTLAMLLTNADEVRIWLKDALVIRSFEAVEQSGTRRHRVSYERGEEVIQAHDKHFIMPYGEYIPTLSRLFINRIQHSDISSIAADSAIVHGNTLSTASVKNETVGALLCSEIFSPHLYALFSRALEVKLPEGELLWQYAGGSTFTGAALLASSIMGSAERLSNGNTLITVSTTGRVYEVTREGQVVWEYAHMDRDTDLEPFILFRVSAYDGTATLWGARLLPSAFISSYCSLY